MPITEVNRLLARSEGRRSGHPVAVRLFYDVGGRFGTDEQAIGAPAFWLRVGDEVHGPYDFEEQAITAAKQRWGAHF